MPGALFIVLVLAQGSLPATADTSTPPIEDNSFLIEEAYNQERGVVQHISTFLKDSSSGAFNYAFTQEWPVDPAPANQLSYTVGLISTGAGAGLSDLWLNWRYQARDSARLAIAPRISVSAPTGDATRGRGAGHAALQVNLPISVRARDRWVLHSNAGFTVVPHASNSAGDRASTTAIGLGQSVVWQMTPRVNPLVEVLLNRQRSVTGAGQTAWSTDLLVSPGVRWAHNRAHGLQIVPGVAVPVTVGGEARGEWSLLGYFSVEHPFTRR